MPGGPRSWLGERSACSETTDEPIERIATRCGFGTAAGMRVHFQRQVGTNPTAYRRTFHAAHAS